MKNIGASTENNDLFDVVIYHRETMIVESVAGKNMRMDTGYYNANKRLGTVLDRLGENYCAQIVPAGLYKPGDECAAH